METLNQRLCSLGRPQELKRSPRKTFCGVSGQLLDKMLNAIDLNRESVYITNVIPWRPPGNRTPSDNEIKIMKPFLTKHIEIVIPKILVAVGGSAAKAV